MTSKAIATVTEKANKTLATNIGQLMTVCSNLAAQLTVQEQLAEDVAVLESKKAALSSEFDEAVRTHKVDLGLRLREDDRLVLDDLLAARNLAGVPQAQLAELQAAAQRNAKELDAAIDKARSEGYGQANSAARVAATEAAAKHQVEIAQLQADKQATANELTFLRQQVAQLQQQVDADRAARIEIAKAESGRQGVVVNTNGK